MCSCWPCSREIYRRAGRERRETATPENQKIGLLPGGPGDIGGGYCFLRFDYFAAAQAGGAHTDALGGRAHAGVHRTQVYVPAPLGDVVGVADTVSELRLLAADITLLSHDCYRSFQRPLTETTILPDRTVSRQF